MLDCGRSAIWMPRLVERMVNRGMVDSFGDHRYLAFIGELWNKLVVRMDLILREMQ